MAKQLYEAMFVLDSGKYAADPDGVTKSVLGILEKAGAEVVTHRPWEDGRLAYEMDGHRRGLHFLAYFKMDTNVHPEVNRACQLNDVIIRHLFIQQPQSLFDAMVTALGTNEAASESTEEKPAEAATEEKPTDEKPTEEPGSSGDSETAKSETAKSETAKDVPAAAEPI